MIHNHQPDPSEPRYLAPIPARVADFNFLLRKFDKVVFRESNGDRSVVVFGPDNFLAGAPAGEQARAVFNHTIFMARGNKAYQLELANTVDTATQYFSVRCRGLKGVFTTQITRDFDSLTISDPSGAHSTFKQGTSDDAEKTLFEYKPLPAVPRVLVHHDSLQYVCFAFERVGAHPKLNGPAVLTTGIRGFQGSKNSWRELDVGSTILAGRGLHNLTIETNIGQFFIPGPASAGSARYTPPQGASFDVMDFDPDDLKDPNSKLFDLSAFKALRSLGLPPEWPPSELQVPGL